MPPLSGWGDHLLEHLFELGPVGNDTHLSPEAISGWATLNGIEWEPWEARLLYRLSREYHAETHQATKWNADPPWPGCIPDFQQAAVLKRARREAEEERRMDVLFKEMAEK